MEELIELLGTLPCYEDIGLQRGRGGCKGIELERTDDGGTVIAGMVITVQEAVDVGTVVQQVHVYVGPALGIIYHEGVPKHLTPTVTCWEQAENCEDEYGSCHALTPYYIQWLPCHHPPTPLADLFNLTLLLYN